MDRQDLTDLVNAHLKRKHHQEPVVSVKCPQRAKPLSRDEPLIPVSVRLAESILRNIDKQKQILGCTRSDLIHKALEQWLRG